MLCKIRILGTNNQARADNLMKGIAAVASAAAGSTPSAIGTSGASSTAGSAIAIGDQYEIVQTVYANDAAGGWTLDANHSKTNNYTSGVHGDNQGVFTMYQATGKTDAPYAFFSLLPDDAEEWLWPLYQFNDLNFSWGVGQAAYNNWRNHDFEKCFMIPMANNNHSNNYYPFSCMAHKDYIIYACEGCIHIHVVSNGTGGVNGGFVHWGTRAHLSWEEQFTDNPYWVQLTVSPAGNMYGYWADMQYHDHTTQTNTTNAIAMKGIWNADWSPSSDTHPIFGTLTYSRNSSPISDLNTGQRRATNETAIYWPNANVTATNTFTGANVTYAAYNLSNTSQFRLMQPIMPTLFDVGITSDETTNAMIPAAVPIWIRSTYGYNMGGNMENILAGGIFNNETDISAYFTDEATYTIDGTEYLGVRWNSFSVLYIKKQ